MPSEKHIHKGGVWFIAIALGVPLGSWMSMGGVAIVASQILLLVRDTDT